MQKQAYFTQSNIDSVSAIIQNELFEAELIKKRPSEMNNPALIVLDMQNYFLLPESNAFVPSAPAIIDNVNKLISAFSANKLPIIFTRHSNDEQNAAMMLKRWKKLTPDSGVFFEIASDIDSSGGIVINKTQYDAFYDTQLDELLREHKVETLVLAGVMANLCIETTARSAFVRGYCPIVPIDAVATYNIALHKASMMNMAFALSEPRLTQIIIRQMQNES